MAIPVWPGALPQVWLRDGYSSQPSEAGIKSDMNSGAVRQRRTATVTLQKANVSFMMDATQFATFKSFWKDTLGLGFGRFTGPVWNGSSYVQKTCRIEGGQYTETSVGLHTQVSVMLLIEGL